MASQRLASALDCELLQVITHTLRTREPRIVVARRWQGCACLLWPDNLSPRVAPDGTGQLGRVRDVSGQRHAASGLLHFGAGRGKGCESRTPRRSRPGAPSRRSGAVPAAASWTADAIHNSCQYLAGDFLYRETATTEFPGTTRWRLGRARSRYRRRPFASAISAA
jgi:hypothetical protein